MKKPVIAIDGYSSTGKSSISKEIAKRLGLLHLDTGSLYRAITWFALRNFTNENGEIDVENLFKNLDQFHFKFEKKGGEFILYIDDKDISQELKSTEISENVSFIAKQAQIRNFLLNVQRDLAKEGGVVMDGRDIGTVILPNADFKFFLTATLDERTERRFNELRQLGIKTDKIAVKENLIHRDKIDSERSIAPLKQADDAVLIDNTHLNKEETIEKIINHINLTNIKK